MAKLNYDADMGGVIQGKFTVNVPVEMTNGVVGATAPPGERFRDFVPQEKPIKAENNVARKDFMKPPSSRYDDDYISNDIGKVIAAEDGSKIKALAKEMYEKRMRKKADYDAACAVMDRFSRGELHEHSEDVERARRIIARTKPLTKKEAMETARNQFYANSTRPSK